MKNYFKLFSFILTIGVFFLMSCGSDAEVPGAVNNVSSRVAATEVALSWEAPSSDGGSEITSYEVSSDGGQSWQNAGSQTTYTFTALRGSTEYTLAVRAVNSVGSGAEVSHNAITLSPFNNVHFDSRGGTQVAPVLNVEYGAFIPAPVEPTSNLGGAGFNLFRGWYLDEGTFAIEWNFQSNAVTEDITLYADWGYRVGDRGPGTGRIFYRNDEGFTVEAYTGPAGSFSSYTAYYLEAAPANSAGSAWKSGDFIVEGITEFSMVSDAYASVIGNGRRDTQIILAYLRANGTDGAAQFAATASFGGYNDWFLPSLGELRLLHANRVAAAVPTSGHYWSSSQNIGGQAAWTQDFLRGTLTSATLSFPYDVRAIRAF